MLNNFPYVHFYSKTFIFLKTDENSVSKVVVKYWVLIMPMSLIRFLKPDLVIKKMILIPDYIHYIM